MRSSSNFHVSADRRGYEPFLSACGEQSVPFGKRLSVTLTSVNGVKRLDMTYLPPDGDPAVLPWRFDVVNVGVMPNP